MTRTKPSKPYPDFPLFPHATGRWAKKIGGSTKYFGPWADPDGALNSYRELLAESTKIPAKSAPDKGPKPEKPAGSPLFAHNSGQWAAKIGGRTRYFGPWSDHDAALERYKNRDTTPDTTPGGKVQTRLNIVTLVNKFLSRCDRKVAAGELTLPQRASYDSICTWTMRVLGKYTLVENLRPDDFARLKTALAKGKEGNGVSAKTLVSYITHARTLFNFAFKSTLIDRPVRYGEEFSRPKRKQLRKERRSRPKKLFSAEEIKMMTAAASPQLKAMILLGVNCGLGNTDCARLTVDHLDLRGGWVNLERSKTEIDRRAKLWPETIEALTAAMAATPAPEDKSLRKQVFLTAKGNPWTSKNPAGGDSPISNEIGKLTKRLKIKRLGVGFYALRHTTETVGKTMQPSDQPAIDYIMGHTEDADDMSAVYNEERPSDARLARVSDHIRGWLFSDSIQSRQGEAA